MPKGSRPNNSTNIRSKIAFFIFAGLVGIYASPVVYGLDNWNLDCDAVDTGGFHNDAGTEGYRAALFTRSKFRLEENLVFKKMLTGETHAPDTIFLTMTDSKDESIELQCNPVAADLEQGVSCVNTPPSEMLVINTGTLRFTRSSIGGWAFYDSRVEQSGDSIYVEYGHCK